MLHYHVKLSSWFVFVLFLPEKENIDGEEYFAAKNQYPYFYFILEEKKKSLSLYSFTVCFLLSRLPSWRWDSSSLQSSNKYKRNLASEDLIKDTNATYRPVYGLFILVAMMFFIASCIVFVLQRMQWTWCSHLLLCAQQEMFMHHFQLCVAPLSEPYHLKLIQSE